MNINYHAGAKFNLSAQKHQSDFTITGISLLKKLTLFIYNLQKERCFFKELNYSRCESFIETPTSLFTSYFLFSNFNFHSTVSDFLLYLIVFIDKRLNTHK